MGFDNECILNIQSLAGEYFCPVCRTLIYPHEALQAQCTHLYCKPCLAYVVSSTQACPYDGYLVTEAGSKPLMESNKALAETIGKTTVHCLYHRSGCVWQGPLSDCTTHCSGCAFGNSPVVCNRCGIQIVHRQVQEHAQTCNVNGTNIQPQQGNETTQDATASGVVVPIDQSKIANQAAAASGSLPQAPNTITGPSNLNQSATANPLPQAIPATAMPTSDQQYYQQYQQYYQQYPGYDPYQQAYQQQYYAYHQQPAQQFQQPPLPVQGQPQPQLQQQVQAPVQLQPQVQTQPQSQGQSHTQTLPQAQPLIPSNGQSQPLYPQAAMVGPSQNQGQVIPQQQVQPQNQPPVVHGHMPAQSYSQVQPHMVQNQPQPHMQVPQYQQPHPQMHHPQPLQVQPQSHSHFQPNPQSQSQPINVQHPTVQPVAGHPPYPSQPHHQIQHAPPQQHPMQGQPSGSLPPGQILPAQFPPPPPHMRPPQPPHMLPSQGQAPGILPAQQHINSHNQPGLPAHQRPAMLQAQQPVPPQYIQQPHAGPFAQQHPQARPLGPPPSMQQPSLGFVQPQQGNSLPHGMPPQSYVGRPSMLNQGGQVQQFPQSSGAAGVAPHARPPQFVSTQTAVNQSNVIISNQPHVYPEQQLNQYAPPAGGAVVDRKGDQLIERRIEQEEDVSASLKKSESAANDFGANYSEVKPEVGMNDEHKPGNGVVDGKDEALTKGAVSELHQIQRVPGDSVTTQRVKEENKDGALAKSPGGILGHNKAEDGGVATVDSMKQGEASMNFKGSQVDNVNSQGRHDKGFGQSLAPQGQIGDVSGGFPSKATEQSSHPASSTEHGRSPHPTPVASVHSGQQQRPVAPGPPSHLRPPGHDYLPHGSHPQASVGEHFLPPGSNQPGSFHPEAPFGGPPVLGSASTWGGGPNNFTNNSSRGYEPQSARFSRISQGEPLGPPHSSTSLPHGPDGQAVPHHPGPVESDLFQNQRPPHFDGRRPDSYSDRGPYGQPFGVESSSTRINGAPPPGLDEKFRTPAGMHPDTFPMAPTRHHEQGEFKGTHKQFSGPSHFGRDGSPKLGSRSSRPLGGYGMDGPSRFLDKDPHGYGYDAGQRLDTGSRGPPSGFLPPYHSAGGLHPNEPGGRPSMHDDIRGRFDNNRQNPDFLGPMHGFGRHHMDRLPPNSPGHPSRPFGGPHSIDGRDMERHPFGERFPMGPPGHMHRGDFDGPVKPRSGEPFSLRNLSGRGEPGFGSYQDYGRTGESNGPGAFSHQPPFGESFGPKSTRPPLGEPGFRSGYSRKGFPSDAGFYAGGPDSLDHTRKRKSLSMGWCRICKVDCETVEGLDIHGQTREHQRMAMDMVISIKQKNSKKQKVSNDHSSREEATKLRNAEVHAGANVS